MRASSRNSVHRECDPRSAAPEGLRFRLLTAVWVIALVAVEMIGRLHASEPVDLALFLFLTALVAATAAVHRRRAFSALEGMGHAIENLRVRLAGYWPVMGLDLRGAAKCEEGFSWRLFGAAAGLTLSAAVFCVTHESWPNAWRTIGIHTVYSLFVVGEGLAWTALATGILVAVLWPLASLRERARVWTNNRTLQDAVLWASATGVLTLAAAGVVICPAAWAFALFGAAAVVIAAAALAPNGPPLAIVWRRRAGGRVHRSDWRMIIAAKTLFLTLVAATLAWAAGGRLMALEPIALWIAAPISTTLSVFFLWTAAPGLFGWSVLWAWTFWRGCSADPSRPSPPTVFVHGVTAPHQRTLWVEALGRMGMRARFAPEAPRRFDVHVDPATTPGALPRVVDERARLSGEFLRSVVRTDEVQKRRVLLRGVEKLWKRLSGRRFSEGSGYWFGLQHWFVSGLWRDGGKKRRAREAPWTTAAVGPRFDRLFSIEARRHFHQVMRGLEVDMIFIEDGVSFSKFRRVLRVLFEVYDVSGGTRRAEERFFKLLPGTEVVIHEYDFADRPNSPVPAFETNKEVACARVLFVFRAGNDDAAETPVPSPAAERPLGVRGSS